MDERLVADVTAADGGFTATMADGSTIRAEKVLAVPGIRHFVNLPAWYAEVPADRRAHTSELVSFDDLAGARVVVVGGRQSAYEWAALLCDHGTERVDVVHRHPTPEFAKVSWAFVDGYVDQTLAQRGWWRGLTPDEQQVIALEFWEVGRLTLEPWLVPRLRPEVVTSRPGCAVVGVSVGEPDLTLTLSDGGELTADFVVFASGYAADLVRVPYLSGVLDKVAVRDGFPELTEGFETSLPGLFVTGLRVHPRLRPVLRLHEGLRVLRSDRGRGDAALTNAGISVGAASSPSSPTSSRRRRGRTTARSAVRRGRRTTSSAPSPRPR